MIFLSPTVLPRLLGHGLVSDTRPFGVLKSRVGLCIYDIGRDGLVPETSPWPYNRGITVASSTISEVGMKLLLPI